jgi:hypothetical protein
MDYKFQGLAKDGSIKFKERENVVKFLESLDGRNLTVVIKEVKSVRSLGWNNFYWAVVIPAVKMGLVDVGYDPDELDSELVHDYLKKKFLKQEIYSEYKEEIISSTKRTSKLNNGDFKEYINQIQRWATQFLHIYIPDPNEGLGLGASL